MYVCIYISQKMGYVIKKNKVMPFSATWMDLEIIIQSELSQKEKNHIITYMHNPKNERNKLIYKTEIDSQKQERKK